MSRNVPKLRFKGFDDEWKEYKLGDLSELITKGTTPKKFSNEGINFVKIESLFNNKIERLKCLFIDKDTHEKELKRSILEENDILFAIAGATIGKAAIVSKDVLPANTNQALSIIRLKNNINNEFVLNILISNIMKRYIEINISVGAQPNLNLEQINNFKLNIPSLQEQKKIVCFLRKVDSIIEKQEKKVEYWNSYKKGMMQKIFSQKIRFKDENCRDYPEWEEKKLGACFLERSITNNNELELLSVTINNGVKKRSDIEGKDNSSDDKSNYKLVEKNDIVYNSMRMWQGASGVSSYRGIVSPAYTILIPQNKVNSYFFAYLFKLKKVINEFRKFSQGLTSDTWNLKYPLLKDIRVKVPCLEEQTKIANFLSNIDNIIDKESKKLEELRQWKKGLLQQMFI
ncbi:restriction endonuclease subunit S [Clostridium perfringens]